jgi:hypothetical protein
VIFYLSFRALKGYFVERPLHNAGRLPVPGTKAKVKYHVFADAQNDMQKPSYCHPDEPWRRRISLFLNTEPLYAKVSFVEGGII